MTSNRETVMLAGRLSGMGYEAECTVSAVKVSLPQLNTWEYVKCDIHLAPGPAGWTVSNKLRRQINAGQEVDGCRVDAR